MSGIRLVPRSPFASLLKSVLSAWMAHNKLKSSINFLHDSTLFAFSKVCNEFQSSFDLEFNEIFMIWPGIRPRVNFTFTCLHVLFSARNTSCWIKHGDRRARRVVGLFCYFCSHKSYILSKTTVDLPLRLKGWGKKVKVSCPLATSSKNLVANAWFLVALATSESQFWAL